MEDTSRSRAPSTRCGLRSTLPVEAAMCRNFYMLECGVVAPARNTATTPAHLCLGRHSSGLHSDLDPGLTVKDTLAPGTRNNTAPHTPL